MSSDTARVTLAGKPCHEAESHPLLLVHSENVPGGDAVMPSRTDRVLGIAGPHGYDHALIAEESRDLTTFQTPLGPHHLCCLPMGWSNLVSIFHGHVTFVLQDDIDITPPFLDNIPISTGRCNVRNDPRKFGYLTLRLGAFSGR